MQKVNLIDELENLCGKYYSYAKRLIDHDDERFSVGFYMGLSCMCRHIVERLIGKKPIEETPTERAYNEIFYNKESLLSSDVAEQIILGITEDQWVEMDSRRLYGEINSFTKWLARHKYILMDGQFKVIVEENGNREYRDAIHEYIYNFDFEDEN